MHDLLLTPTYLRASNRLSRCGRNFSIDSMPRTDQIQETYPAAPAKSAGCEGWPQVTAGTLERPISSFVMRSPLFEYMSKVRLMLPTVRYGSTIGLLDHVALKTLV